MQVTMQVTLRDKPNRKIILARQQEAGWGAKVIDRLPSDLQAEFPESLPEDRHI